MNSQKTIFLQALEEEDLGNRDRYLDQACGQDTGLRASVEALLVAHSEPENPLDKPLALEAIGLPSVDVAPTVQHIGLDVGPYRLMEQIGEGGFGLVFVAQQEKPVRRKVALKIIKPGNSSREVLARFDAERQAVAMMDHPSIAKVFDAGVTDDGRPYFVMELVRGVPLTDFCDNHRQTCDQRLGLFQDVCAAVQHAHHKGVVHRDLKPSNVMVTLHDDRPVVKVIDFGVAKAIGQTLTDMTIYTRFFSMIGTPLYMSPEQAEMSGLDVDTRSDIYSLGVLLYELLTGTTPFDRERLDSASYDEMRRIILEEEPPRPSKRLTTLGASLSTVSETRHSEPSKLTSSVRGDLDWIVMKALEKDRTRRYESAAAMADDVRRYLSHQPIEARPPSQTYRLTQFTRRNRVAIVTTALVAAALITGTGASLYTASVALEQRDQKEIALSNALASEIAATQARLEVEQFADRLKNANALLGAARIHEESDQLPEAAAAYAEAIDLVPNYYLVWVERARMYAKFHLWEEAASDYSAALQLDAPISPWQWLGVPALFELTHRSSDFDKISGHFARSADSLAAVWEWERIRGLVASPLPTDQARQLSADAVALSAADRPGRGSSGGGDPGRRGPPRRGDNSDGPPSFRGPDDHRKNWRGGNPFGRRGMRFPPACQHFVVAWAHYRANQLPKALEQLEFAAQDPSWAESARVNALRAMVHWHSGREQQAQQSWRAAAAAMESWIDDSQAGRSFRGPWFDLVEDRLLLREASKLLGQDSLELEIKIEHFQRLTRQRFEFDNQTTASPTLE